jgi:hypothetical protein
VEDLKDEPFVLEDVIVRQEGQLYRYRCARSLSSDRWSVVCADNVSGAFSLDRQEQQDRNFAELLNEMHPFVRMRPRPSIQRALAEFGDEEDR